MARISIPLDAITSRLNLQDRFSSVRSQSIAARFANLKPVSEFLDIKRLSKPNNFGEIQSRVNYNLAYFSSNYAVIFVMLTIYSLITNPWLLFDIISRLAPSRLQHLSSILVFSALLSRLLSFRDPLLLFYGSSGPQA